MDKFTNPAPNSNLSIRGNTIFIEGTPVGVKDIVSPGDGEITKMIEGKNGYYVHIQHTLENNNKITSVFFPVVNPLVSKGSIVTKGQRIGSLGKSTINLSFYKNYDTQPDNPKKYLGNIDYKEFKSDNQSNETEPSSSKKQGQSSSYYSYKSGEKFSDRYGDLSKNFMKGILAPLTIGSEFIKQSFGRKSTSKKKKDDDTDLSPDIQFEEFKRLVSEDIVRIKELMK